MLPKWSSLTSVNIFATDKNPAIAARNLCDKHINKMIVESAQMLANAFTLERLAEDDCPRSQKGQPRTHGYPKHPCTLWSYETTDNFEWLCAHALEMGSERRYRWSDRPRHFSLNFIAWCYENIKDSIAKVGERTDFAIAISDTMNCRKIEGFDNLSSVDKYRLYYKHDKPFVKWTKRSQPAWF